MFLELNFLAVGVATVVHFIFGTIWYAVLFRDAWMEAINASEERKARIEKGALVSFLTSFVGSIILAWTQATLAFYFNPTGWLDAIWLGVFVWVGYGFTVSINTHIFERRRASLFFIDNGYMLVGFVIVSLIVSLWR